MRLSVFEPPFREDLAHWVAEDRKVALFDLGDLRMLGLPVLEILQIEDPVPALRAVGAGVDDRGRTVELADRMAVDKVFLPLDTVGTGVDVGAGVLIHLHFLAPEAAGCIVVDPVGNAGRGIFAAEDALPDVHLVFNVVGQIPHVAFAEAGIQVFGPAHLPFGLDGLWIVCLYLVSPIFFSSLLCL